MSLDQNLFTLAIAGSTEEAGALDLTDPNTNTIYYRKRINPPTNEIPYSWGLWGIFFPLLYYCWRQAHLALPSRSNLGWPPLHHNRT